MIKYILLIVILIIVLIIKSNILENFSSSDRDTCPIVKKLRKMFTDYEEMGEIDESSWYSREPIWEFWMNKGTGYLYKGCKSC